MSSVFFLVRSSFATPPSPSPPRVTHIEIRVNRDDPTSPQYSPSALRLSFNRRESGGKGSSQVEELKREAAQRIVSLLPLLGILPDRNLLLEGLLRLLLRRLLFEPCLLLLVVVAFEGVGEGRRRKRVAG